MNIQPLPDTITIGIEDYAKELMEIIADLEGRATYELVVSICVDFAKLHMSYTFVEHIFEKIYNAHYKDKNEEETNERFERMVDLVVGLTEHIEREIAQLKLLGEDEYIPYTLHRMLGTSSIVLGFRQAPVTNLENPESKRFDPLEHA